MTPGANLTQDMLNDALAANSPKRSQNGKWAVARVLADNANTNILDSTARAGPATRARGDSTIKPLAGPRRGQTLATAA